MYINYNNNNSFLHKSLVLKVFNFINYKKTYNFIINNININCSKILKNK